jgi:hypothetical protein
MHSNHISGPSHASNWLEIARSGSIKNHPPEDIFNACAVLNSKNEFYISGLLLQELAGRAASFLVTRINTNLPNNGRDVLDATVEKVFDAALGVSPADAAGFGRAFYARLGMRLADQIRVARKRGSREQGIDPSGMGEDIALPDMSEANPEQALMLMEMLADVDPRKREALSLVACGYPVSSTDPSKPSVSSMLDVSARTAEAWVREMKAMVLERMRK